MTFGDRLRELREKAGLTQESLAHHSGMSIGSVRNYEQGIREPYWKGVFQLASALGVSSEAFAVCVEDDADTPTAKPAPAKRSSEGDAALGVGVEAFASAPQADAPPRPRGRPRMAEEVKPAAKPVAKAKRTKGKGKQ